MEKKIILLVAIPVETSGSTKPVSAGINSRPVTDSYRSNWDNIFGKQKVGQA